jgi:hypothetical protein
MALNLEHGGSEATMNDTDTEMRIQAGAKRQVGLFMDDRKDGDYFWALYKEVRALMLGFESAISWSTDNMYKEVLAKFPVKEGKLVIGTDKATGKIMQEMTKIDSEAWEAWKAKRPSDLTCVEYAPPSFRFKGSGNEYERVRGYYDRIADEQENMIENKVFKTIAERINTEKEKGATNTDAILGFASNFSLLGVKENDEIAGFNSLLFSAAAAKGGWVGENEDEFKDEVKDEFWL